MNFRNVIRPAYEIKSKKHVTQLTPTPATTSVRRPLKPSNRLWARLRFQVQRRGRLTAAAGSVIFFALAPGVVAGLIPWWLTGWRMANPMPAWGPVRVLGALVTFGAAVVLVSAFARFVTEGVGTPAPVAPTRHLVVGGLYRYVRNPMYIAVVAAIVGQALFLGQLGLFIYAAVAGGTMAAFARWFEEPVLLEQFGDDYAVYRRAVPGWWPRMRPWKRE